MEGLFKSLKMVYLVVRAFDSIAVENLIGQAFLFFLLVEESVRQQAFIVHALFIVCDFTRATEDFKSRVVQLVSAGELFGEIEVFGPIFAQELSCLHTPFIDIIVDTECLELVFGLDSV